MHKRIASIVSKLQHQPLARYIGVGGLSYIFEIGVLLSLYDGMGTNKALAATGAFWIGLIISFVLQKLLAFQDYRREVNIISRQALYFGILVAINYSVTVLIVSLFPGKHIVLSRTLALLLTTSWNYFFYKIAIFRK